MTDRDGVPETRVGVTATQRRETKTLHRVFVCTTDDRGWWQQWGIPRQLPAAGPPRSSVSDSGTDLPMMRSAVYRAMARPRLPVAGAGFAPTGYRAMAAVANPAAPEPPSGFKAVVNKYGPGQARDG